MTLSLDISTLAAAYAEGRLTPERVLAEIYARIERMGQRPVWIAVVPQAEALARLAKAPKGPLWGIPFAVKDNLDVAGMPTTAACPDFAHVPERSATVVERLEAAGAILIGKTNLDQFATGLVGTRSPYGICSSVFSPDHVSGGSSSGSAVAVAAGLVSFSLGTDTAGSGRVPAAFNNIVGLKPTKGLISTRGLVPACRTLDCVSIFAGTVGDAAAVLDVAAGYDAEDAYSRREPALAANDGTVSGLRFGVPLGGLEFFGDAPAATLYRDAIARMESLGAVRVDIDFSPFKAAAKMLYAGPWVAERLAAIKTFAQTRPQSLHHVVGGIIRGAERYSAVETFEAQYAMADLIRAAQAQWAKMDVLLLPTAGTTYRIDEMLSDPLSLNSNLGVYTNFTNLMDLAAVAIPAGFRPQQGKNAGLPFGVTLLAPAFSDRWLARVADGLHRAGEGVTLAATGQSLPTTGRMDAPVPCNRIRVAVVGAHLAGLPLHGQLTERGARLCRTARTAAGYSLYALPGTVPAKPGLVYDGRGSGGIEVEVYEMDHAAFGSFVGLIPPPLGIGTLTLADGGTVLGFLCESHALASARDITAFGGWRTWLKSGATSS